jgi:hypothetical protein
MSGRFPSSRSELRLHRQPTHTCWCQGKPQSCMKLGTEWGTEVTQISSPYVNRKSVSGCGSLYKQNENVVGRTSTSPKCVCECEGVCVRARARAREEGNKTVNSAVTVCVVCMYCGILGRMTLILVFGLQDQVTFLHVCEQQPKSPS